MSDPTRVSILPDQLNKGDTISGDLVWIFYTNRRPDMLQQWIDQHGSEEAAKLTRLPRVLLWARNWIDAERRMLDLPPLVINTAGGNINVLTDVAASSYLNSQAYQGLSRHRRATDRLINAVDVNALPASARREHENRINVHAFIASASSGAQRQLRAMERAGKPAPAIKGSREAIGR